MNSSEESAGRVASLWRYPVKSMLGEELDASDLTERGFVGDRSYALLDPSTGDGRECQKPEKVGADVRVPCGICDVPTDRSALAAGPDHLPRRGDRDVGPGRRRLARIQAPRSLRPRDGLRPCTPELRGLLAGRRGACPPGN